MRSLLAASLAALLSIAALFAAADAAARAQQQTRRFSLIAGANDGGAERVRLRYAGSDAASMARVLGELGGVAPGDQLLLLDPDRLGLQRALHLMASRLEEARRAGYRVELFFYYSGHSDEEGLLLGEERFGYQELRQAIEGLPAEVRVAILDSCASGTLTRRKGGVMRPPFLLDASSSVEGHAFLTASSADEAAQESDRIGASFFTHHLVSGLRGAADTSGRGRVTLNDAYTYAYRETLSTTERTQHGAQHPAYEMQLVGSGDLVITDLRAASAGLILDEELGGRIFVRGTDGNLVVEVRKQAGTPLELGLAPGDYAITLDEKGALFASNVSLHEGVRGTLHRGKLREVERERTVRRGDAQLAGASPSDGQAWEADHSREDAYGGAATSAASEEAYEVVPFSSSLIPEPPGGRKTLNHFGLHLIGGRATKLDGTQLSLGVNLIDESVEGSQIALGGNFAGTSVRGTQAAIGVNAAGGSFDGSQVAVGASFAGGSFKGFQGAVGATAAGGSFEGAQLSVGMAAAAGGFEGFQSAVGLTAAEGPFVGGQLSVGLAAAGGDFEGLQSAVGLSAAAGSFTGAQLAVGAAFARDDFVGVQSSVGPSITGGSGSGVQIATSAAYTGKDSKGLQTAAGAAITGGAFQGAQIGGAAAYAGEDLRGAQIAAGASISGGRVDGFQTAAFSYAGEIDGLQLSIVNFAGTVEGSQIGVLNLAGRNKGLQLGVLNFANESDVSIGVLSFVRNGRFDLELSASDVNVANAGLQLGTRYVYGILSAGLSPRSGDAPLRWTTGAGLGTRIGFGDAFLDFLNIDLTVNSVRDGASWESENLLHVLRLGAGWQLAPQLAITVGPSLNVFTGFHSDRDDLELIPGWVIDGEIPVRIWPGFFAAVQI